MNWTSKGTHRISVRQRTNRRHVPHRRCRDADCAVSYQAWRMRAFVLSVTHKQRMAAVRVS